jgi:hypothetical protein
VHFLFFAFGCTGDLETGEPVEDSDPPGVDCGDASTHDIEITARVVSTRGTPAAGIDVILDDRGWTYGPLGSGVTDVDGLVTFTAAGVTSLPNCWGTVLNYWVVATDPADPSRTAEDDMNTELYNAIDGGTFATDISDRPLEL